MMAVGLVVVVLQLGATSQKSVNVPRVQAVRNSFNIIVRSIGELDAGQAHMVASTLKGGKGKMIELVDDGKWVKSGDVLVRLDPAPFEEEIQNLQGEIKRLEAATEAKKQLFEWGKKPGDQRAGYGWV